MIKAKERCFLCFLKKIKEKIMLKNKVKKKYEVLLFSFIMAVFMTGLMSFFVTWFNMGLVDHFVSIWLQAYWKAFIIAFPTVLVVVPYVRRFVIHLVEDIK